MIKQLQFFLASGKEVAGDLTAQSKEKWTVLQSKYRLEDAQTEPLVSLFANDNWVEYNLRFVVSYKNCRVTKTVLFIKILNEIEATNGKIKFASATFQLVEASELNVSFTK